MEDNKYAEITNMAYNTNEFSASSYSKETDIETKCLTT